MNQAFCDIFVNSESDALGGLNAAVKVEVI